MTKKNKPKSEDLKDLEKTIKRNIIDRAEPVNPKKKKNSKDQEETQDSSTNEGEF